MQAYTGDAFTIQHLCVGHLVLPPNVQEAPETPKMVVVQPLLLACVCSPCFDAVQKKADNKGMVDVYFGVHCLVVVAPDPLIHLGHERRSMGNSDVHLCIKVQSAGDGGGKVGEVVHHL